LQHLLDHPLVLQGEQVLLRQNESELVARPRRQFGKWMLGAAVVWLIPVGWLVANLVVLLVLS
jgi:hypothetical protein